MLKFPLYLFCLFLLLLCFFFMPMNKATSIKTITQSESIERTLARMFAFLCIGGRKEVLLAIDTITFDTVSVSTVELMFIVFVCSNIIILLAAKVDEACAEIAVECTVGKTTGKE